jgi:hypothetical protein
VTADHASDQAALESTQARALALLEAAPWEPVSDRLLLLLVRPPAVEWAGQTGALLLWAVVDSAEARTLPVDLRAPLLRDGAMLQRVAADAGQPSMQLAVFTSEGIGRLIEGVTRRSLETRWSARHAEPLHDPLHRFEMLVGAAARLPATSLERIVRPLYVQAAQALEALAAAPLEDRPQTALLLAGEAASAVCRIACVMDEGSHPPAEWLAPAARATRLGARVASWLDDLPPAVGGDARAARWIRDSGPGVLRELVALLRAEFAGRDWLDDPLAQAIRPAR